jgi:phosphoribosylformylglycinamidine cyclo-ligase
MRLEDHVDELGRTLGEELLRVHRSYVTPVERLREAVDVRALAHITGGGIPDNVPRVLPGGLGARVRTGSWEVGPIFELVGRAANLSPAEAHRTFNMGVGLVAVVPEGDVDEAIRVAAACDVRAWPIGEVVAGDGVELV